MKIPLQGKRAYTNRCSLQPAQAVRADCLVFLVHYLRLIAAGTLPNWLHLVLWCIFSSWGQWVNSPSLEDSGPTQSVRKKDVPSTQGTAAVRTCILELERNPWDHFIKIPHSLDEVQRFWGYDFLRVTKKHYSKLENRHLLFHRKLVFFQCCHFSSPISREDPSAVSQL
jgi:hypothetical protein